VPPYTKIVPLQFEDYPFSTEHDSSQHCQRCGANDTFLTSHFSQGQWAYFCSDTSYCNKRSPAHQNQTVEEVL